jgi:hypothetical protein
MFLSIIEFVAWKPPSGVTPVRRVKQFSLSLRCLVFAVLVSVLFSLHGLAQKSASNPTSDQCGIYAEAYKAGSGGYDPYLKFTDEQAKTRDRNESSKRYSAALAKSAPQANALWLSNWCSANPLKDYAEASNRLLDELTGQASGKQAVKAPAKSSESPATVKNGLVINLGGTQAQTPNSCKVGGTQYCGGCSIACNEGEKASCMVGTDSFNGPKCFQGPVCRCK